MATVPDLVRFFVKYSVAHNQLDDVVAKAREYADTFPLASAPQVWWQRFALELEKHVPEEDLNVLLDKLGDDY